MAGIPVAQRGRPSEFSAVYLSSVLPLKAHHRLMLSSPSVLMQSLFFTHSTLKTSDLAQSLSIRSAP